MNDNIYWQELGSAIRSALGLWVVLAALIIAVGTLTYSAHVSREHCGKRASLGTSCHL
jgi:hypothetical protein